MHTGKIKQAVAAPHMPPSPVSKGAAPPASAAPALKAPVTPAASPATAGYKNVGQTFTPTPVAKPAAPAITAAPTTQPATRPATKPPQFDQFTEALRGQRYGNTFGTQLDPKSQETQKYWQNYQQQLAAAQQGGQPLSADNEWMLDPKVVAQKYILDAEKNRINAEHTESQGTMPFLQRLFGFRRGVNSGMDEQITADNNIGQNPNGLSGAVVNTLASPIGGAAAAGSVLDQAITGDDQSAVRSGVGRDNVSLINHLLGIDLGHDVNLRGNSDIMYDAKSGLKDVFTQKDKATSPGFMGDVYDPLTQSVKPSTLTASRNMAKYHANNTDEDIPLYDRIAAGAFANATEALPYIGAGMGAQRLSALRPLAKAAPEFLPAAATQLPQYSAAAAGIPTLIDPNSNDGITDRLLNTARDAATGGVQSFNINPAWAAAQPIANASGVQDYANIGADWVRNNISPAVNSAVNSVLPTDGNNKDVGEFMANAVSGAPGMLPALFTGALSPAKWKAGVPGIKDQAMNNLKQTGKFTGIGGATNTVVNRGNEPDNVAALPVAEQQQQAMTDALMAMAQQRYAQGLPENKALTEVLDKHLPTTVHDTQQGNISDDTQVSQQSDVHNQLSSPTLSPVPVMPSGGELSADGAGAPSATTPPATETQVQPTPAAAKTTALEILPTAPAIEEYAQTNPEQAQVMQQTAGEQLQTAAKTQDGQAQLKSLNETGDLTPEAHEAVKYNLLNDGFDSEEIGKWYNKLEGPEKFALWGGLSMTMLGLIQALNGGGAGSWITTLLGLGTAGLAAGSTGLLGDQAQDTSQKVTKPVGEAVGGFTNSVANSVLSNPTALKALAPMLEHLPDNAVKALQAKIREVAPDKAEQLDAATAGGFFFGGMRRDTGIEALQTQLGLSPEQAGRFLDLWTQKS